MLDNERELLIKTALAVEGIMCDSSPSDRQISLDDLQAAITRIERAREAPSDYQQFVAGLLFSDDGDRVVLIRKTRPEWQRGMLNAVGGKIDQGESPHAAMSREFTEETSANVQRWTCFCRYYHHQMRGCVYFFWAKSSETIKNVRTITEEKVTIRTVEIVTRDPTLMHNLRFLIPLALAETLEGIAEIHEGHPDA